MRIASTTRTLVTTVAVVVVLAAALSLLCADGVHVPTTGAIDDLCAAMTHSTALGVSGVSLALRVATMFAVAIVGLATMLNTASARPVTIRSILAPARSADPLNGRFRL